MNLIKKILLLIFITSLCSCVDYKINEANKKKEKKYYASSGFALIYNDNLYIEKVVNKKIDNEKIRVMHNVLKPNTLLTTNDVMNTNKCNISICKSKAKNKIIILCSIDNLIKGGAGQAIQNLNLLYNFKEDEGFKK